MSRPLKVMPKDLVRLASGLADRIRSEVDVEALARKMNRVAGGLRPSGPPTASSFKTYHTTHALCLGQLARYSDDDDVLAMLIHMLYPTLPVLKDQDIRNTFTWHARWGQYGMPTLKLTTEQAASFSISQLDPAHKEDWQLPWPAFYMPIPEGLLDHDGQHVHGVSVYQLNTSTSARSDEWNEMHGSYVFRVDSGAYSLWMRCPRQDFEKGVNQGIKVDPGSLDMTTSELSARKLAITMLINSVSFLNSGRTLKEVTQKRKRKGKRAGRHLPKPTTYTLDVPVKVNVVRHVRQYVSGTHEERKFTARWLVRGHIRNQAHGPDRSLRKQKWIEPHWKGPESEAVRIKEHVIGT